MNEPCREQVPVISALLLHLNVPSFPVNTHNSIGRQSNFDGHDSKLITFAVMANKNDLPLLFQLGLNHDTGQDSGLAGTFPDQCLQFLQKKEKKERKKKKGSNLPLAFYRFFSYFLFGQRRIVVRRGKGRTTIFPRNLLDGLLRTAEAGLHNHGLPAEGGGHGEA